MKIKFLETVAVQDSECRSFVEGKTYDLSVDSCNHWIVRGMAELDDGTKKAAKSKRIETASTAGGPERAVSPAATPELKIGPGSDNSTD